MVGDAIPSASSGSTPARAAAGLAVAVANFDVMSDETRIERRLDRLIEHAVNPRKAAVVIATVTTAITLLTGWLMTIVDHTGFPTLGSGMWWAVQTVTTVGYGDHVPETFVGQLVAALVMLLGIGFLTVITAAITSTFVARARRAQAPADAGALTPEQFRQLDQRLERIEAALSRLPPR